MDDGELAVVLGVRHQSINGECHRLESQGRIARRVSVGRKIQNCLPGSPPPSPTPPPPSRPARPTALLKEDEVKAAVSDYLTAHGYEVAVAWGHQRGIDIEARQVNERNILIEAKGEVSLQPQQVNYFLSALGELVQRLNDPHAFYGLALPDNRQYRGLVDRLPPLARERLRLIVFFVRRSDEGFVVTPFPDRDQWL